MRQKCLSRIILRIILENKSKKKKFNDTFKKYKILGVEKPCKQACVQPPKVEAVNIN